MSNTINVKERKFDMDSLPKPVGWRILVAPLDIEEITAGGIVLPDSNIEAKQHNQYVGQVVAMGESCFKHPVFEEIGSGNWCEVGDWVLFNQYAGMGAKVYDESGELVHLRFINDQSILAVTNDPASLDTGI